MTAADRNRHQDEQAFVLHSYPFRETSLILDVFSRRHGRLAIVARGARRPRSALRGVLMNFQPLLLSWFGKGEVRTLHSAEWQGGQPYLQGTALMCGFYLNELLLNLLARDDPHEQLFDYYRATLYRLAQRSRPCRDAALFRKAPAAGTGLCAAAGPRGDQCQADTAGTLLSLCGGTGPVAEWRRPGRRGRQRRIHGARQDAAGHGGGRIRRSGHRAAEQAADAHAAQPSSRRQDIAHPGTD